METAKSNESVILKEVNAMKPNSISIYNRILEELDRDNEHYEEGLVNLKTLNENGYGEHLLKIKVANRQCSKDGNILDKLKELYPEITD